MPAKNRLIRSISLVLNYSIFGLNVIVLVLLLTSYSVWNTSPQNSIYLAYLGLIFIFVLIAAIVFLIFWFISRKWIFVCINVLVLIICYTPIKTYIPLSFFGGSVDEDSIKILSYNVRGFNWEFDNGWEKNPIFTFLKESDADVICLQEYVALSSVSEASTQKLRSLLGYPYYSVTKLRSNNNYVYGLACFSKYPIINVEQIPINTTDNGSVLYNIDYNGKTISVINNHLESNRLTSKDKELYASFFKDPEKKKLGAVKNNIDDKLGKAFRKRAPQAEMIAKYIDDYSKISDAIIVCGDFNDTPMSYTYSQISNNMIDSYTEVGFGPGITYHENHFLFRIDFIFHSPNMEASNFVIDKIKYSDHYPISTYLKLKD